MSLLSPSFRRLLLAAMFFASAAVQGQPLPPGQNREDIRQSAIHFLEQLAPPQAGEVNIQVGDVDTRLNLAQCDKLTPFLPQGARPWGKISVGIRCSAPVNWTVYLQANVRVTADYYITSHAISAGQVLTQEDLSKASGDLSQLPAGAVINPEQAIGKTLQVGLASGGLLRTDMLKSPLVIQQGQAVKVVVGGPGFQVSTEAQSLNNASEGQVVRARTPSGQTVTGIAKAGGTVEINYQ